MGSTRLPGKILMPFCGNPSLIHFIERAKQSKLLDDLVVATSTLPIDDVVAAWYKPCFRGSEQDVLDRFYQASIKYPADIYVRLTADCPLIDPYVIDDTIRYFLSNDFDYASNMVPQNQGPTFPRGLDCEVFTSQLLEEAWRNTTELYDREHVTPYMYQEKSNHSCYRNPNYIIDVERYRWTLDTPEDYEMISAIYEYFYKGKHDFYLLEILEYIQKNQRISDINAHVRQKGTFSQY